MIPKQLLYLLLLPSYLFSQNYQSWRIGNAAELPTQPAGGVCLMGGATENDQAMKWFLQRANGGDVLVLRASGQDGYNSYLYSDLGIVLNSVETIRFNNASASYEPYILQRIAEADAIWLAGGDQWDYVSFWRSTPVDSLINTAIHNRNCVIGGTSAGMAVLGEYYFSAQSGTISSFSALNNPTFSETSVSTVPFLKVPFLDQTITDTHYDNPDRKGRHIVFMANAHSLSNDQLKGIACDEYTAVCIDTSGWASVYGDFPSYDDNAYFLQMNCSLPNVSPEIYTPNVPMTWNYNQKAIQVYKTKGTPLGQNGFNLSTWSEGNGGEWSFWSVNAGNLTENVASQPDCLSFLEEIEFDIYFYPNPTSSLVHIYCSAGSVQARFYNQLGEQVMPQTLSYDTFDFGGLTSGIYTCELKVGNHLTYKRLVIL